MRLISLIGISLQLADWSLRPIWQLLTYAATHPLAIWQRGIEYGWLIFTSSIGSLILLLPRGFPARWVGLIWLLPLMLTFATKPNSNSFWLTILDVGQGLAIVVETRHHVLVYDTGPKFSANFNAGDAVLIPFLRQRGIHHINRVIISHGDLDHRGGLSALAKQFAITNLLTSEPKKINSQSNLCLAGQHWQWDGVKFEVLYPNKEQLSSSLVNDGSCVLRISVGQHHVLLTGDIEKAAEQYLVKHRASQLTADILIVPHHGSRTSSTLAFIQAVNPEYAIFSTGYYNRFRFPTSSVVQRYHQHGITTFNTAETGAITFKIYADKLINFPELYRLQHARVWR